MSKVLTPVSSFDDVIVPSGTDLSDAPAWEAPLQALANRTEFVTDEGNTIKTWANLNWLKIDVQEFTADGAWTRPAAASKIVACLVVTVDGGGQGGHAPSSFTSAQPGGGSGQYRQHWARPDGLPVSASVIIGQGGNGASVAGTAGDNGGVTYIDDVALAFRGVAGEFGLGGDSDVNTFDTNVLIQARALRTFAHAGAPGGFDPFVGAGCAPGAVNPDTTIGGAGAGGFIDNAVKLTGDSDGREGGRGYGAGGAGGNLTGSTGGLAGASGYCSITTFYIETIS